MKLAITGGGSGGHTLPAVTIHEAFKEYYSSQNEEFDSIYIGSHRGIERDVATAKQITYFPIATGKLRRYFSLSNLTDLFRTLKGILDSYFILRRFKPQVVFSTGGFVSVPVSIAARMMGIPVVIHEQTSSIGLANKIASYFATKIATSFTSSNPFFPAHKVVHTGQPIRKELFTGSKEECYKLFKLNKKLPIIYVTGGSQGSHKINTTVKEVLIDLLKHCNVIHQCGRTQGHQDFEELQEYKLNLPKNLRDSYVVKDFIQSDELKHILSGSALLIGRAGAGTVNESLALRIPSIFIPLPLATRNEQYHNAKILKDLGGAEIIEEKDLSSDLLKERIISILLNLERREQMSKSLGTSAKPDATELIIQLILESRRI